MPKKTDQPLSKEEGRADLTSMWKKTANAILRALDADEPSASCLEVARKFMADNEATISQIREWSGSPLGNLVDALPTFTDDDDSDLRPSNQAQQAEHLRNVADFRRKA